MTDWAGLTVACICGLLSVAVLGKYASLATHWWAGSTASVERSPRRVSRTEGPRRECRSRIGKSREWERVLDISSIESSDCAARRPSRSLEEWPPKRWRCKYSWRPSYLAPGPNRCATPKILSRTKREAFSIDVFLAWICRVSIIWSKEFY